MNVKPLVNWAEGALFIVDQKPDEILQFVTPERLEEKLAWLREYRADIHQWSQYQRIIDTTLGVVRHEGYFEGITPRLKAQLEQIHCTDKGTELCAELIDFAQKQSDAARPGEHLPGSSEILESAMGKFKFLEKDQSRAGFTHLVLGFATVRGRGGKRPSGDTPNLRLDDALAQQFRCVLLRTGGYNPVANGVRLIPCQGPIG